MELLLDKINIALIIAIFLNLFLGVMVFFNGPKRKINVIYSFNIMAIVSWLAAMFFYRSALPENNTFWCTVLYVTPTLIASSFLYFTYIFPSQKDKNVPLKAIIIFFINLIIVLMVAWPGFIIREINVRPGLEKEIIFTKFYIFYFLYTFCFFSFGFSRLFQRYRRSAGIERLQILYLLIGYAIAANLAFVTNLIMPWIGFFFLNWLGQIFTVIMVAFASYAITRYNLMDIKVVATEFFSGLLIVASLVPIFEVKSNWELVIRIIILAATIFFAVLIVRSVIKEANRVLRLGGHLAFSSLKPGPNFEAVLKDSLVWPLIHLEERAFLKIVRYGFQIKKISQFLHQAERQGNAHYLSLEDWAGVLAKAGFEVVASTLGECYAKQGVVVVAQKIRNL